MDKTYIQMFGRGERVHPNLEKLFEHFKQQNQNKMESQAQATQIKTEFQLCKEAVESANGVFNPSANLEKLCEPVTLLKTFKGIKMDENEAWIFIMTARGGNAKDDGHAMGAQQIMISECSRKTLITMFVNLFNAKPELIEPIKEAISLASNPIGELMELLASMKRSNRQ